jgi:hypothetical protein
MFYLNKLFNFYKILIKNCAFCQNSTGPQVINQLTNNLLNLSFSGFLDPIVDDDVGIFFGQCQDLGVVESGNVFQEFGFDL